MTTPPTRTATVERKTKETDIACAVNLDAPSPTEINTGLGFLDHMLDALSKHAAIAISLTCKGDLHIDDHHTAEDCAIALGQALDKALADRAGIARFGSAYAPLDEALARTVVDLVTRPHASIDLRLTREKVGDTSTEMLTHFLETLATNARLTLHTDVIRGSNDHHKAEAAFKSLALTLKQAIAITGTGTPSTKGVM